MIAAPSSFDEEIYPQAHAPWGHLPSSTGSTLCRLCEGIAALLAKRHRSSPDRERLGVYRGEAGKPQSDAGTFHELAIIRTADRYELGQDGDHLADDGVPAAGNRHLNTGTQGERPGARDGERRFQLQDLRDDTAG